MVYDVKSWWLMPYTIPVYISEVSQLNFPWVFLIIMHSNVFPKVPPRQNPFSKAPSPLLWLASFQAFEDTIESAKSAAQTMKRRNSLSLSVLVCICNTNWEWYPTRTCCAKTKVRRKKKKRKRNRQKKLMSTQKKNGTNGWRPNLVDFFSRSFGCYFYNCWPTGKLWRLVSSGCYRNLKLGEFHWLNQNQKPFRGMRIEQAMP